MFIEIEDLKQEPLQVSHIYGVGQLKLALEDVQLNEPVRVDFVLNHKDKDLQIEGSVRTAILYKCSRCLKELSRALTADYSLVYVPQPKGGRGDEEISLKYDEMDIAFYDGIRLDVDLMIIEQIELSLPMRFICREDCRGLCHVCGADLNQTSCACKKEQPDSRLAPLLEFRHKLNKE